jgi:hypothetical protein
MRKTLLALLAIAILTAPATAQQPVSQSGRWFTEPTNVVRTGATTTLNALFQTATLDTTGAEYLVAEFDTSGSFNGRVDFTRTATGITSDQHFFGAYNLRNIFAIQTGNAGPDVWTFGGQNYTNPILALAIPPGTATATVTVTIYTSGSMTVTLRAVHSVQPIAQMPIVATNQIYPVYLTALGGQEIDGTARPVQTNNGQLRVEVTSTALNGAAARDRTAANDPSATRLTDGTNFYKATTPSDTQPVSAASLPLPTGAATSAKQGDGSQLTRIADAVNPTITATVKGGGTTASGADKSLVVAINPQSNFVSQGNPNLAANAWFTAVTDGTNTAAVKAASTAAAATDPALVVAVSPNNAVAVTGTFWQATQPVSSTQLPAALAANGGLKIEGVASGTPVPISGSIANTAFTANAGTNLNTSALALDATLTGGTQQTKITDGTNLATVKAASTAAAAADKALVVAVSPNNGLALDATLTGGTAQAKITDGTNVATVKAASTAAAAADKAVVVAISPNNVAAVSLATVPTHSVDSITTAIVPGTAATNLGKAEDAGHTSGDTGVMTLGVRKDTATQQTSTDADYGAFSMDAYGAQFTRVDHPNRIRCTVATSTAIVITAVGGSCVAPGAGLSIYITDIQFSASAAGIAADAFPTLKYGTGGTCGTGTTVFWGALTAAAIRTSDNFNTPLKIPANNEVCWITTTAGSKFIVISGFIAP